MDKLTNVVRWNSSEGKPGTVSMTFAFILLVLAAIFTIIGLATAFTYDEGSRLVGGDAFNLQILAVRGLIWVGAGIVCGTSAIVHVGLSIRSTILASMTARQSSDGMILWTDHGQAWAINHAAQEGTAREGAKDDAPKDS